MSGTNIAYGAVIVRASYAVSGTDIACAGTDAMPGIEMAVAVETAEVSNVLARIQKHFSDETNSSDPACPVLAQRMPRLHRAAGSPWRVWQRENLTRRCRDLPPVVVVAAQLLQRLPVPRDDDGLDVGADACALAAAAAASLRVRARVERGKTHRGCERQLQGRRPGLRGLPGVCC
eukprot:3224844-Rhodomonas_salina.7